MAHMHRLYLKLYGMNGWHVRCVVALGELNSKIRGELRKGKPSISRDTVTAVTHSALNMRAGVYFLVRMEAFDSTIKYLQSTSVITIWFHVNRIEVLLTLDMNFLGCSRILNILNCA